MSADSALRALVAKWRAFADENDGYALEADSIGLASECVAAERKAKSLRACADELESVLSAPQAAPAGMVLVPREPTQEMTEAIAKACAGRAKWPDDFGREAQLIRRADAECAYLDMLAAAPAAQVAYPSEGHGCIYPNGDGACQECADLAEMNKAAAPAVVVDDAMIDAALFCTPRGGSMDEDLAMPIDFMGLGQPEKLPLARQVMGAALAAALNQGKANG